MENQISTYCSFYITWHTPGFLKLFSFVKLEWVCVCSLSEAINNFSCVVLANETNATTFQLLIYMQDLPLILWISVALIGVVIVIQQDVSASQRTQNWYWISHSFHNRSIVCLKISSMAECCSYDGDWELL